MSLPVEGEHLDFIGMEVDIVAPVASVFNLPTLRVAKCFAVFFYTGCTKIRSLDTTRRFFIQSN